MNILALDLGTKTGYAYNYGAEFRCGTWELASPREITAQRKLRFDRRLDRRIPELWKRVHQFTDNIDVVVFEDVQFSSSTMQTQLWSSLRAAVWLSQAKRIDCVPTGTLKKFAGHGGAKKEAMAKFLCRSDSRFERLGDQVWFWGNCARVAIDDNAVDAVWIWKWTQATLSRV